MYRLRHKLTAFLLATALSGAAHAQDGFDPRDNCLETLSGASSATKIMAASWVFGFLASKDAETRPVDFANIETLLGNLANICGQNPGLTMLGVVDQNQKPAADTGGSAANARQFLMQFYDPASDLNALTQALRPSEAEIHAIYQEPLASKLVPYIAQLLTPEATIRPDPEHDDIMLAHATTTNLINGDAVLQSFPGGYKEVVQYMNEGFPIVRFKFIKSGETFGMAFDGLIYVNDRWVIIPTPWRALD